MKRKFGIPILLALLCALVLGVAGCSKRAGEGGGSGNQLASVKIDKLRFTETANSFSVSWERVPNAESYELDCNGFKITTEYMAVNLRTVSGFTLPDSGEVTVTVIAKGTGYKDSAPVTKKYTTEGLQLRSPEIISFNNGVIQWSADSTASSFILKVNNRFVSDGNDNLYRSKTYNVGALAADAQIDITALGDGVWLKDSGTTSFKYSVAGNSIKALPITSYSVDDETISWGAVGGASCYKVVDLDFNVTRVTDTSYDMSDKNIVYGIYPVMGSDVMDSADIEPVLVRYLNGSGTATDPYLIKTPFDLRAIDYYEARYAELGGQRNYYRLENDIDYNAVNVLESSSNMYTLRKPFYGTLDGNGKKLSNIRINYNGGYWSMFDFLAAGSTVKNITFDSPEISNKPQDQKHPVNATIAMVAYRNYGTVTQITVNNAKFTAIAGEISGVVSHNFGTVSACTVSGAFVEGDTNMNDNATAAYEMGGVVLENCKGGIVDGNTVTTLSMRGTANNICTAAGICSVNRAGGIVRNNSYESVTVTNMNAYSEYGGVTAYDAVKTPAPGTTQGTGTLGTFTVGTKNVTTSNGTNASDKYGKLVGKCG